MRTCIWTGPALDGADRIIAPEITELSANRC